MTDNNQEPNRAQRERAEREQRELEAPTKALIDAHTSIIKTLVNKKVNRTSFVEQLARIEQKLDSGFHDMNKMREDMNKGFSEIRQFVNGQRQLNFTHEDFKNPPEAQTDTAGSARGEGGGANTQSSGVTPFEGLD